MSKLLFLALFFTLSLFGDQVVYLSYDNVPQRVIKGEIFAITLKSISTLADNSDISYVFSKASGIKILDELPLREIRGKYVYDTFHFLTTRSKASLPDIEASLIGEEEHDSTTLPGQSLNVITLNPKADFSNVIADSFELLEYKTTSYDNKHNIVIFVAQAKKCDINAMAFKNVKKQGVESVSESYEDSRITYYVVIDKELEKFSFSYFNLTKNNFSTIDIPIVVIDDSVVTQTDLKPKDQSRELLKIQIASVVAFLGFLFILWRKKYVYLALIFIPLAYILYHSLPQENVCVEQGSELYLLPVSNGTIFETTKTRYVLPKEGAVEGFVKIKLQNEKIGWVKNENICSY